MSHSAPREPLRPSHVGATLAALLGIALLAGVLVWWAGGSGAEESQPAADRPPGAGPAGDDPSRRGDRAGRDREQPTPKTGVTGDAAVTDPSGPVEHVVVISVDGLGSDAVTDALMPNLTRLLAAGTGTLNARTAFELTVTLPNHTSMVTGLPIALADGGHGVTWNDDTARDVPADVDSVFSTVAASGGDSAVFVGKSKFTMWGRSWPGTIDELTYQPRQHALVRTAVRDLRTDSHTLTFLHLAGPDSAGHDTGWGSPSYQEAVVEADGDIGAVLAAVQADPDLVGRTAVVVTADHGGQPGRPTHGAAGDPHDYVVPFAVWGPGVAAGADLYALNPDYRDPGAGRPGYGGAQPVRNGHVANLVTDLLGLDPVPGSLLNAEQDLTVSGDR